LLATSQEAFINFAQILINHMCVCTSASTLFWLYG
jgi:hypothetical protein